MFRARDWQSVDFERNPLWRSPIRLQQPSTLLMKSFKPFARTAQNTTSTCDTTVNLQDNTVTVTVPKYFEPEHRDALENLAAAVAARSPERPLVRFVYEQTAGS